MGGQRPWVPLELLRPTHPSPTLVKPFVVVVGNMLLFSAGDGIVMLQQANSLFQSISGRTCAARSKQICKSKHARESQLEQ